MVLACSRFLPALYFFFPALPRFIDGSPVVSPVDDSAACPLLCRFVPQKQLKEAVKVLGSGSLLFASYLTVVGDERFYANQLMPLLQKVVGAETAHVLAVKLIGLGVVPLNRYRDPPSLVRGAARHTFGLLTRQQSPNHWAVRVCRR